tara:strand:+ start:195 stop:569 length:375 start_codon:yes stop_codon:yes gene_type:complete
MPGSERQNSMFKKTRGYFQEGNPFPVTSCGRRRNDGSPLNKLRKTTKGKGRHFLSVKEGAGMTEAGRRAYNKETGGNLKAPQPGGGKRKKSYCARSLGQMKMHNINCKKTPKKRICAARRRWKC